MGKKLSIVLMMIILAVVVAACGANPASESAKESQAEGNSGPGAAPTEGAKEGEELTITHQLGETKVKKNPEKVVVFDFGALDTLDRMGVEVAGVPQANIPSYLSKYEDAKYENVGSLKEPDFEKINAIDPDLIIISGRQSESYQELSKIAPTIFLGVDTTRYMDSFTENVETLGKIFDKQSLVEEELAKVNEAINNLNEKASASGKNALVVLANGGKVSAYGPGSRFGIIHDVFGLKPVDENIEASTHGMSISFEYIVEKDPDYLFVIDRDAVVGGESSAKQVIENDLIKNTKAFKNGNIVYLNPEYWYLSGGGLVSVSEMIKEVETGMKFPF
jgi:iron complex transport system substrate-binding protein